MSPTDSKSSRRRRRTAPDLSAIERRCLTLVAEGRTPGQIVLETDLPLPRVAEALTAAMEKLEARNMTGAVSRAALLNLI